MEELIKYIKAHKQFFNTKTLKYITQEALDLAKQNNLTIQELCYRIKHDIPFDKIFTCAYCGKKIQFKRTHGGYQKYCSISCLNKSHEHIVAVKVTHQRKYGTDTYTQTQECKDKVEEYFMKKYGVKTPLLVPEIQKQSRITTEMKFGKPYYSQTDKSKQFMHDTKEERLEKVRNTTRLHFDKDYYLQTEECKTKTKVVMKKLYGVEYFSQTEEWLNKTYNTKKQNGTFNTSELEKEVGELLKQKFSDVKSQYRSKLYPFNCDFYIPELDLYIECNGHWTHGKEPFDKNNPEHIKHLEFLQGKAEKKNSKFYRTAVYVWTDLDVRKLETFKKNKLNYKIFWNIEEVKAWINSLND